jgi:hypothetical protein
VRRPGKARGSGSHIPARELALPQSAPRYDKKGRYLPTVYIYQQTNGEFRILSPGGGAAAAPPSEEGQPAGGQPAAPGGAPSSGPGKEPGGGNTPFAPEGVPADAPRP